MEPALVTCPNCGRRNRVAPAAEGVPRCGVCQEPLPWLVDADPQGFDAAISASVPVLVDFWAPWCGPCRWIEPIVEELARSQAGRLKVVRLNIDEAAAIAERYDVRSIPLLVVMRDGRELDRLAGAASKQDLEAWLERRLAAVGGAA